MRANDKEVLSSPEQTTRKGITLSLRFRMGANDDNKKEGNSPLLAISNKSK
jgi:hypothetical protein